jgi:hypothetical protein
VILLGVGEIKKDRVRRGPFLQSWYLSLFYLAGIIQKHGGGDFAGAVSRNGGLVPRVRSIFGLYPIARCIDRLQNSASQEP